MEPVTRPDQPMIRETVGVFHQVADLEASVLELESSGFDRADISLLAAEAVMRKNFGDRYRRTEDLQDDPEAPRTSFVGKPVIGEAQGAAIGAFGYAGALGAAGLVFATGGAAAAAIAATVVGGGAAALVGSALAKWIGDQHAEKIDSQIRQGGLLLWVKTPDGEKESTARRIMSRHAATDVHAHALPA